MQSLINNIRPNPGSDKNEVTTAKNVQRALAVKLQDFSAAFRKKQKIYMQREWSREICSFGDWS